MGDFSCARSPQFCEIIKKIKKNQSIDWGGDVLSENFRKDLPVREVECILSVQSNEEARYNIHDIFLAQQAQPRLKVQANTL